MHFICSHWSHSLIGDTPSSASQPQPFSSASARRRGLEHESTLLFKCSHGMRIGVITAPTFACHYPQLIRSHARTVLSVLSDAAHAPPLLQAVPCLPAPVSLLTHAIRRGTDEKICCCLSRDILEGKHAKHGTRRGGGRTAGFRADVFLLV